MAVDHKAADYWFTKAASLGNPTAYFFLACLMVNGDRAGTPEEAAADAEIAARRHNAQAAALYGRMVMTGKGVPMDKVEGAYWMRRAVRNGSAWGEFLLGVALTRGDSVLRDEAAGLAMQAKAARDGFDDSAAPALMRPALMRPAP